MAKWVKNKIELPDDLDKSERKKVGSEVLDYIRKRTTRGLGKGGKKFPAYSKQYIASLDFRNAAKKSSKVNLKLSGDMMAALDVLSHKKGQLLYGFENKTPENDRAEGNVLGSYGGNPNSSKARDFMGLTKGEIDTIVELSKEGIFDRIKRGLSITQQITLLPERTLKFLAAHALLEQIVLGEVGDERKKDSGNSNSNK